MFDFTLICNQSYKVMKPDKNDSNSFSVLMNNLSGNRERINRKQPKKFGLELNSIPCQIR